jgi:hypothetical protein
MSSSGGRADPEVPVDPRVMVSAVVNRVSATQPYLSPTPTERADAGTGLARLIIGDQAGATELLGPLGFSLTTAVDPVTGRRYALAVSASDERAWGLYLVDLSGPPRLCIAVPHPRSDRDCEHLALRLWRSVPGSILALAAVHRDAAGGTADHARNPDSVFHQLWTAVLGPRGLPQVQVHGFADATAAEQVVVSTGAGPVSSAADRIAAEIAATGLVVTRNWDGTADPALRAVTNLQGIAADAAGWVWVHLEYNRTVRADPALWEPAIDAVAAADPGLLARDRPSPGGPGHEPAPVSSVSRTGTSRLLAREDHAHAGADHSHPAPSPRVTMIAVRAGSTITVDSAQGDYFRLALSADHDLAPPVNGTDGQRILIEAYAVGADRILTLHPRIQLCQGTGTPITIPAERRWFGELLLAGSSGWVTVLSAVQARTG